MSTEQSSDKPRDADRSARRSRKKKDSIDKMRGHLKSKLRSLESSRGNRVVQTDEDVKLQNYKDSVHLDWMEDNKDRYSEEERKYLYLSSITRDKTRWPNPGEYMIQLDSEINNVIKADLVQFSFPLTDPTVNTTNQIIRYAFSPYTTVNEVVIPVGSYLAADLALEIMKQMNMSYHNADILAGTYFIDETTGFVVDGAGALPADPYPQFRVKYVQASHKYFFQIVDASEYPLATPTFALHIGASSASKQQQSYRSQNDDLWDVLGFDRTKAAEVGTYNAATDTYYLVNTTAYTDFGPANDVDKRIAYGLNSSRVAELRGGQLLVLDIDPLNNNDIGHVRDTPNQGFDVGQCFGMVLARDAATVADRMLDVSNGSYPIQKYYRDGRSRIRSLKVTIRRLDGSIFDFGGADHFMAIRLTTKQTQPGKSVFTR
jgi:hypothetical protein